MKLPMKRWNNDDAFPKKELYFNLRSNKSDEDEEITYEFSFLTENAAKDNSDKLWFKVKDILKYKSQPDIMTSLIIVNGWNTDNVVMTNLLLLHERLVVNELINYFEVKADSIDDVLDIFIRVNSGGTVLSKSDLLYSTIVSHWDKARDEVDELLISINKIGDGFKFSNDFIMRTCLYLLDLSVALKVETFGKDSVLKIRDSWDRIKTSIKETVELLNEWGFSSENIISYVAVTPIVYYKYKGGLISTTTKTEMRKYFIVAQLRQVFGASNNTALTHIRDAIKKPGYEFSLSSLQGIRFAGDRNLRFTAIEVEELFDIHEKGAYTFMILSLLYPSFKFGQKGFHQDHLHPYVAFEPKNLSKVTDSQGNAISSELATEWKHRRNTLANLQLLECRENESKNKQPLADWLAVQANKDNAKYIPTGKSLELSECTAFWDARKDLMLAELKTILLSK